MSYPSIRFVAFAGVAVCVLAGLTVGGCSVEVTGGSPQVVITVDEDGSVGIQHEGSGSAMYSTMSVNERTELNLEASTFGGDAIVEVTGEAEADGANYRITLNVDAARAVELRIDGLSQVQIQSNGQTLNHPAELSPGAHELTITGSR